jgi:protein pelota
LRILERNDEKGTFKLRITDRDDLWYLYQVADPGMIAGSLTNRKLESRDDQVRADAQPRVKVYLKVIVEETEFHPFTDALRLKGSIFDGPPDISGHHTLNVEPGTTLDIENPSFTPFQKELLQEAEDSSKLPKALALTIDDESAELFRLREYGIEPLGKIGAGPGGKRYPSKDKWEVLVKDSMNLVILNIATGIPLIITGPGFLKEAAGKEARKIEGVASSDVYIIPSSSAGISGLKEALTKGEGMGKLLENMRFARESGVIEDLMSRIGKGKGATYGMKEVSNSLSMGAVEILLITEDLFRENVGKELLKSSSDTGATHMVISTSHEGGQILEKLGGVAALLRFEI